MYLLLVAIITICLFPIWPIWTKIAIFYISLYLLIALVIAFFIYELLRV